MIEYKPTRNIAHAMCFESFVALEGREDGLTRLWLLERRKDGAFHPSMSAVWTCRCSGTGCLSLGGDASGAKLHVNLDLLVGGAGGVVSDSLLRVDFDEELYEVEIGSNKVFASPYLRFQYSSLTTPARDLDLDTRRARGDVASRDTL